MIHSKAEKISLVGFGTPIMKNLETPSMKKLVVSRVVLGSSRPFRMSIPSKCL